MTPVLASIVDWEALGKVVMASFVAGVGVTLSFSIAIAGVTRFADLRRDGRVVGAAFYAVLGAAGFAVTIAALVAGLIVMTTK
jgi:hypothetical protein